MNKRSKTSQNKFLLFFLISLFIIVFLFLLYTSVSNQTKKTTALQQSIIPSTITPTTLAYLELNNFPRGNVFLLDQATGQKKQLTFTQNVTQILGWSRDNNYLLVKTEDDDVAKKRVVWFTQTLNLDTLKMEKLNLSNGFSANAGFSGNKIVGCDNESKLSMIDPNSHQEQILHDGFCGGQLPGNSENLKWTAYTSEGEGQAPEYIIQSLSDTNKYELIGQFPKIKTNDLFLWRKNTLILGALDGIYEFNPESVTIKKLVPLSLNDFIIGGIRDHVYIKSSLDLSSLYYQVNKLVTNPDTHYTKTNELFRYDFATQKSEKLVDLMTIKTQHNDGSPTGMDSFSISGVSKNNQFIILSDGESNVLDLQTQIIQRVCPVGTQCGYAVWAN